MNSIAIIGTGIAGMACGHLLHKKYDITIYEKNNYVGGHTNTITVDENGKPVFIDTGFMVYNEITYPNLTKLFKYLNVETKPTSMSFSVQHKPSGLEFSGSGYNGLFAQRKNIFSPSFLKLLKEIDRFNKESVVDLENEIYFDLSMREYARIKKLSDDFLFKYLIPMSSAVWSTPPDLMLQFPAITLIRFFKNHGFLGLNTQHQWRTVVNGSQSYREKLIAPFKNKIFTNSPVSHVLRKFDRVKVITEDGIEKYYDKVIFACHADQALQILKNPTDAEYNILKNFKYQKNSATLHTDNSVMPKTKRAWSSWNYRLDKKDGKLKPSTIYYMNSLQQVSKNKDYFLSIDDSGIINPGKIIKVINYEHPIFSLDAIKAQKYLPRLNDDELINYCGSYFNYGFHEDALTSAIDLCKKYDKVPVEV